jgi:hypothetical protein
MTNLSDALRDANREILELRNAIGTTFGIEPSTSSENGKSLTPQSYRTELMTRHRQAFETSKAHPQQKLSLWKQFRIWIAGLVWGFFEPALELEPMTHQIGLHFQLIDNLAERLARLEAEHVELYKQVDRITHPVNGSIAGLKSHAASQDKRLVQHGTFLSQLRKLLMITTQEANPYLHSAVLESYDLKLKGLKETSAKHGRDIFALSGKDIEQGQQIGSLKEDLDAAWKSLEAKGQQIRELESSGFKKIEGMQHLLTAIQEKMGWHLMENGKAHNPEAWASTLLDLMNSEFIQLLEFLGVEFSFEGEARFRDQASDSAGNNLRLLFEAVNSIKEMLDKAAPREKALWKYLGIDKIDQHGEAHLGSDGLLYGLLEEDRKLSADLTKYSGRTAGLQDLHDLHARLWRYLGIIGIDEEGTATLKRDGWMQRLEAQYAGLEPESD